MISYTEFQQRLHQMFSQDPELNAIPMERILSAIPTVDQMQDILPGSPVLLRLDLDVPLKDGKIEDASRIEAVLPTLKYCISRSWKIVILAHIGRDKKMTLLPVREMISEEIGQEVVFISDWLDETEMKLLDEAVSKVGAAGSGSVLMFDNARKYDIERALWQATEETFPTICRDMYSLAQDFRERVSGVEINDAIAASNFDFTSSVLPLAMLRTGFGFFISEEMRHIKDARQSNMIVISGLKIDKLNDLEGILRRGRVKWVIAAGSLAMALKKAQAQLGGTDFHLGRAETDKAQKTYISPERIEQGKRIVRRCLEEGVNLILPIDFVLDNGEISEVIPDDRLQLDVGPHTRQLISRNISEYISQSKQSSEPFAMFFSGVFGKFEDPRYETGTRDFISHLRTMTEAGVKTYVGGGEGRLALLKYGSITDVTHAFTGGGTGLKALSDKHIQYLKALYLQNVSDFSGKEAVAMRTGTGEVAAMIEEFLNTTNLQRMESLADALAARGDRTAIDCLLYRLGDIQVQEDPDVQDAVCSALVKFGVMRQLGNLNFRIENEGKLDRIAREALEKNKVWIPQKYFQSE